MFMPAAGLLLRDDLHHRYDRLEWSFYHTVSNESSVRLLIEGGRLLRPLFHTR
jgi:hypothetical protein